MFMFTFRYLLLRAPADGDTGGSFFTAPTDAPKGTEGPESKPAGEAATTAPAAGNETTARPDWLIGKYATVEDQAKGYSELFKNFSKKTDDLRVQVKDEAIAAYGKTIGVPDTADAYAYPEGFTAPAAATDKALRDWAHKNNVSPEGFASLISDVQSQNTVSFEAEKAKLGDQADERIGEVNRWIGVNVDKGHFGTVAKVMQSADGVAFMEAMAGIKADAGFAPGDEAPDSTPLTRDAIRTLQADPRFMTDEAFRNNVRAKWDAFGRLPADQRR